MGAASILKGMIDAADFKQYIFPLLFFKRIGDGAFFLWVDKNYYPCANVSKLL